MHLVLLKAVYKPIHHHQLIGRREVSLDWNSAACRLHGGGVVSFVFVTGGIPPVSVASHIFVHDMNTAFSSLTKTATSNVYFINWVSVQGICPSSMTQTSTWKDKFMHCLSMLHRNTHLKTVELYQMGFVQCILLSLNRQTIIVQQVFIVSNQSDSYMKETLLVAIDLNFLMWLVKLFFFV